MTELSLAAQAVWSAYEEILENECVVTTTDRRALASALRAAVAHTQEHHGHDVWECDADELLAVADELEAQ